MGSNEYKYELQPKNSSLLAKIVITYRPKNTPKKSFAKILLKFDNIAYIKSLIGK